MTKTDRMVAGLNLMRSMWQSERCEAKAEELAEFIRCDLKTMDDNDADLTRDILIDLLVACTEG